MNFTDSRIVKGFENFNKIQYVHGFERHSLGQKESTNFEKVHKFGKKVTNLENIHQLEISSQIL